MVSYRASAGRFALSCIAALGLVFGSHGSAVAGSDNSNDAWAGDVGLLALPPGTVIATEYIGYRHGDAYITSNNNIFAKLGGGRTIPSNVGVETSITRFSFISSFMGAPIAFSVAANFARADTFNIGNLDTPKGAFGQQSIGAGWADPTAFFSYGLIVDPRNQRFLTLTNYFYFPAGNYDKFKAVNFSTADQYTWVPQIGYAEGLAKFGMKGFWIDVIANMSLHSNGNSPLASAPGIQFDRLTQSDTYNLKGFLRYEFMPLGHVAVGIEKSWGGNQMMTGGVLGNLLLGPTSFGMEDYTKGHVQLAVPLSRDFQIAADITHDFQRVGGIREDFTAEIRLTKLFTPAPPSAPQSLK